MTKRICLVAVIMSVTISLLAQKIEQAKEYLKTNKLSEAKAEIDRFFTMQINKKNPDALYTKAKIYSAVAMDAGLAPRFPDARMDAFIALKQYTEVDDKMLIALQIDGYKPINDIYTGFYTEAATNFNEKKYDRALTGFINAITVSAFMTQKGWISLKLDTNSVLYAGVAAEKLGRLPEAATHYGSLIEARAKGSGFDEIHKWIANYYYELKDYTTATNFLKIGKEVYPGNEFWPALEIDIIRQSGNREQLFATYEQVISGNPANHLYLYNYAVELCQYAYNIDMAKRPSNSEALINKAQQSIRNALQIRPDYTRAQLFAGQIAYNKAIDVLKTNKPAAMQYLDEAIPYFLKVEKLISPKAKLTSDEKADLSEVLDLLITIYGQKKMDSKVKEYEQKLNDAKKRA